MATTARTAKRTATREQRRQELIASAIKCIARKGLAGTTIGDVASQAGLSQGIVNLHFDSKDNLFFETLRYLADEYRTLFDRVMEGSGPSAAAQLKAIMELDLRPAICDRQKIAVWFAFWGEVKSQPTYRKICEKLDDYYEQETRRLCEVLIKEGGYERVSGKAVATILTSISNGLWLSCLISPKNFDRQQAIYAVHEYLQNVFPKHFPMDINAA